MTLVAFIGANILADIHTGMETIAQIITSEIIAIIMEARSVIDVYWNPVREII